MFYGVAGGSYQPISIKEVQKIHNASMYVFEKVGFEVENERALNLFAENGAEVDFTNKRVKASEDWIMMQLKKSPARVILYGREDQHNLVVEPNRTFLGTGGTAVGIIDYDSGLRRHTVLRDVGVIARLIEKLKNIHWFVLPVYPNDLENVNVDVNRFFAGLNNTTKHIMGGVFGPNGAKEVIKMAQILAGGEEQLRARPNISITCSIMSPLKMEKNYVDHMFEVVKAGVPLVTSCAPIAGATSPITLAGTLVQLNVEALSGILLAQLIKPGAPVLYSVVPTTADMRTMGFLFGAVENGIMNSVCAQLATFYNLPMYATGGTTEAKIPDAQTGYEKAITTLMPALAGAQLIHESAGLIDSGMTVSLEQYVIDDEINGMVLRAVRGIEIDEKTLAAEVIEAVGPGGNYLSHPHTVNYLRTEAFIPELANRMNFDMWKEAGCKDIGQKAREKVCQILAKAEPILYDERILKQLMEEIPGIRTKNLST
ncbi:MAG: trimethylamine methyltransferase family protein [Bacillota bacterium]|nr:trimethylamine methyltransferase family protein [Bacillota bacterium]